MGHLLQVSSNIILQFDSIDGNFFFLSPLKHEPRPKFSFDRHSLKNRVVQPWEHVVQGLVLQVFPLVEQDVSVLVPHLALHHVLD